jgi:hypothetical protein
LARIFTGALRSFGEDGQPASVQVAKLNAAA